MTYKIMGIFIKIFRGRNIKAFSFISHRIELDFTSLQFDIIGMKFYFLVFIDV